MRPARSLLVVPHHRGEKAVAVPREPLLREALALEGVRQIVGGRGWVTTRLRTRPRYLIELERAAREPAFAIWIPDPLRLFVLPEGEGLLERMALQGAGVLPVPEGAGECVLAYGTGVEIHLGALHIKIPLEALARAGDKREDNQG